MLKAHIKKVTGKLDPARYDKNEHFFFLSGVSLIFGFIAVMALDYKLFGYLKEIQSFLFSIVVMTTSSYFMHYVTPYKKRSDGKLSEVSNRLNEVIATKTMADLWSIACCYNLDYDRVQKIADGTVFPTVNEIVILVSMIVSDPTGHVLYILSGEEEYKYHLASQIDKEVAAAIVRNYESMQNNLFYSAFEN